MLVYQKHIFRNSLFIFCITCFAITAILWLIHILKIIYLINKGSGLLAFLKVGFIGMIPILFITIPISLLISTSYIFFNMKFDKELIILENAGIGPMNIMRPVMQLCISLTIVSYILSFYLLPWSFYTLKNGLYELKNTYISSLIYEKAFNHVSKNLILYIEEKAPSGDMSNIILLDNSNENKQSIFIARKGRMIIQNNRLIFDLHYGNKKVINLINNNLEDLKFDNLSISFNISKASLPNRNKDLQEFYFLELIFPTEENINRINEMWAESLHRLIWPIFNISFCLLLVLSIITSEYSKQVVIKKITYMTLLIVLFLFFHFIFINLSIKFKQFSILLCLNSLCTFIPSIFTLYYNFKNLNYEPKTH